MANKNMENKETLEEDVEIIVNGIKFHEIRHDTWSMYGEINIFPFMGGYYVPAHNRWIYHSLKMNNKYYVPTIDHIKQQDNG